MKDKHVMNGECQILHNDLRTYCKMHMNYIMLLPMMLFLDTDKHIVSAVRYR